MTEIEGGMTLDEFREWAEKPLPLHKTVEYWVGRQLDKPGDWMRSVKWGCQRARRGYSEADVWGLDYYLLRVMIGTVKELREITHGHPTDLTAEKWDAILAEIVSGLEGVGDDFWNVSEEQQKSFRKSLRLMAKHWFSLWD